MSDEGQGTDIVAREQKESLPTTEVIRRGANLPQERWTRQKIAAARKLLPKNFRQPEYCIAYLARAERAGLDPLLGELHAWEDKGELTFHVDISGWVNIAANTPSIAGVEGAVINDGDEFEWERKENGKVVVRHKGGLGGDPIGAYCVVRMEGEEPDHIEIRRMEDYTHLAKKKNWRDHPKDMILIRAYEAAVSKKSTKAAGIYAKESFEMSDGGRVMGAVQQQVASEATDEREEELAGKLGSTGRDVTPPPPEEEETPSPTQEEAPTEEPEAGPASGGSQTKPSSSDSPDSTSDESEDEETEADEVVRHTEDIPEGYAIMEVVFPDKSLFMPCTLDLKGQPDEPLLEDPVEDYKQARRLLQGQIDRPESTSAEEDKPADEGGIDDTPKQPCPVCGEMLNPSQMGGHKSGHSKRGETLPSDDYRVQKVGEDEYRLLHEGVVIEELIPNYLQALALAEKHAADEPEDTDPEPEPEQEEEDSGPSEKEKWSEQFQRIYQIQGRLDLGEEELAEVVEELYPNAMRDGSPRMSAMTSAEMERVGDRLLELYR